MISDPPPPPPPPAARPPMPPMPPLPPLPDPFAPKRSRRYIPALAVTIVGVLVVAALAIVTGVFDDDHLPHPDAWDPRVAELAEYVEGARGLDFEHPVFVDFLSPEDYTAEVTTEEGDLDEDQQTELDRLGAHLRAFGLASGELDLFDDINTVTDGGTLAFYRPDDARVRVRGTELSVGVRVTLVHELTHALQDQHFDLAEIVGGDLDDGESDARRALVEGDALRIEDQYVSEALSEEERTSYQAEYDEELAQGEAATADVPSFVTASFGLPYALGRPFVTMLDAQGGNDAVDDALRDPPTTAEHLFDPVSYLDREKPLEVELGLDDIETDDDGTFGPAEWYLLLGDRIDPKQALEAALGWGGSAYGSFERDERQCIRVVFAGDEDDDDAQTRDALAAWHNALPEGLAPLVELLEVKDRPGLEACDPGPDVDVLGADRADELLVLPAVHAYLEADAASVLDTDESRCYARTVIDHYSSDELLAPGGAVFTEDDFEDVAIAAVADCRRDTAS